MRGKRRDAVYCSRLCKGRAKGPRTAEQREAHNAAQRARYRADAEFKARSVEATRRARLRREYGLTDAAIADYDAATHCAACGQASRLVVDHDHVTGDARGFICPACNTALGHVRDDPAHLMALIHYLDRYDASRP
jgi:uncharacterized protein YuzB (UPF0349 family)